MADIMSYKVNMRLTGRLTQLPDSQKIFGALVYLLAESNSEDYVSEFVDGVKNRDIKLELSNMLPAGCLPVPQGWIQESVCGDKEFYKLLKKRKYMEEDLVKQAFQDPEEFKDKLKGYSYIALMPSQQIHASIESGQYHLSGLDPNLYSVPEITVVKVHEKENGAVKTQLATDFYFYLSLERDQKGEKLVEVLEAAKENSKPFFLGPRSSQGLNTFSICSIQPEDVLCRANTGYYLNTGMLLPDRLNYEMSTLHLFTSERRPYVQAGGWNKQAAKRFISFVQEGSIVVPEQSYYETGKSIAYSEGANTIVFGNAFLYPITIGKGDEI